MQSRRQFLVMTFVAPVVAACSQAPTAPPPVEARPISLLKLLQATGYPALEKVVGEGRLIEINGSIRWNFLINGVLVGIGNTDKATLDVPNIQLLPTDNFTVIKPK